MLLTGMVLHTTIHMLNIHLAVIKTFIFAKKIFLNLKSSMDSGISYLPE